MARRWLVAGLAVAALVVGLVALHLLPRGVLPNVTVVGVELGGRSADAARAELEALAAELRARRVLVRAADITRPLDADAVGAELDVEATLAEALALGRRGDLWQRTRARVVALWRDTEVGPVVRVDDAALTAWIEALAAEVDAPPHPGSLHIDPDTLEVSTGPPAEGRQLDRGRARALILAALRPDGPSEVDLPVVTLPARVDPAAVEQVAAQAREALTAPLVLRAGDAAVTLAPTDLARILTLREVSTGEGYTVALAADPTAVEEIVGPAAERFEQPPEDARFDLPREPPVRLDDKDDVTWRPVPVEVRIIPSRPGRSFDPDLAATQIAEVLAAGQHEAELRLREVEPEFTTEDARAFGITHLIGTFTTYHACCQARVTNIHLLADMVDGTLVAPGEQFSVNRTSGERTCSKGFRPAGMILNGELVDVCGGGVSQFGTTVFNAAFFAGLPIDQYKAHSWYISRYPMGREATLNYPDLDVRWTNDTGHGILVRTSYTATSITVSLYGDNGGRVVSAIHGRPRNFRPYPTVYREDPSLPPGTSQRIQAGAQGFDVTVVRVITYPDGREVRETYFTRYTPIPEIIARNSTAPPPPTPEPTPSPSVEPEEGQ